jgi:hypothetical protein
MKFEIGQIFEGRYPPEVACWCELHSARMVRHGAGGWIVELAPQPTDGERDGLKREELRQALAHADWRSMREHDRKAADPTYPMDPIVFSYKQFLRDFDSGTGGEHWNVLLVPTFDEYAEWYRAERHAEDLENKVEGQ